MTQARSPGGDGSNVHQARFSFDAEAHGAIDAALRTTDAVMHQLDAAENALRSASRTDLERRLERTKEFLRLFTIRLKSLARQVAEESDHER